MEDVKSKCSKTTQHIADKILLLRRAKRFSQEKFAEFVGLDTRTVTRAENGRHRPSPETLEMIATAYQVPVCYFYDETVYDLKPSKASIIEDINKTLNTATMKDLKRIKKVVIDMIN